MCSFVHQDWCGGMSRRHDRGQKIDTNRLIFNSLQNWDAPLIGVYHFGSASAHFMAAEEALVGTTSLSIFSIPLCPFYSPERRPKALPLIPAHFASLKRVAPQGAAFFVREVQVRLVAHLKISAVLVQWLRLPDQK
jgi:hypothetical protein